MVLVAVEAVFVYFLLAKGYFDRFVDFCSEHLFIMFPIYAVVIVLLLPGFGVLVNVVVAYDFKLMVQEFRRSRS